MLSESSISLDCVAWPELDGLIDRTQRKLSGPGDSALAEPAGARHQQSESLVWSLADRLNASGRGAESGLREPRPICWALGGDQPHQPLRGPGNAALSVPWLAESVESLPACSRNEAKDW